MRTGLPLRDPFGYAESTGHFGSISPDGRFLKTYPVVSAIGPTRLGAASPTGPGDRALAWLLRLATVCAGRRLNESAKTESALDEFDRFDDLRREIAAPPPTPSSTLAQELAAESVAPTTAAPARAQRP